MSSNFITRVNHEDAEPYTVIFKTDDEDKYAHIEDECRAMIGHAKLLEQPTVDAVPVEWIKAKIERLKSLGDEFASLAARTIQAMLNDYGAGGERR